MDDYNIDRKHNRKMSIHMKNNFPRAEVKVAGNTMYVNLYGMQQIVQNFSVSFKFEI